MAALKPLHLVLVIVLLAVALGFVVGSPVLEVLAVNTSTRQLDVGLCRGMGATGGQLPGELLDDDEYIASWSPALIGQRVTFQGAVGSAGAIPCPVQAARYLVYLNAGSGDVLVSDRQIPIVSQISDKAVLTSAYWDIKHPDGKTIIPHGSRISLQLQIQALFGSWATIAIDEARILSGIGSVEWGKNQYEIGERATLAYRIPYVSDDAGGKGWSVQIYSAAANRVVVPSVTLTQTVGSLSYDVGPADFEQSAGCRNELVAVLTNELWDKDFDTATTIDASELAPSVTIDGFTPESPDQGDRVTVRFTTSTNAASQLAIEKVVVKYGYGGVDKEEVLPATAHDYSFVAGSAGTIHVEVIAYDGGCRPSPTAEVDIHVEEPPPPEASILFWVVLAAFVAIGLVVAVASPTRSNWILTLVIVAVFAAGGVFAGYELAGGWPI